MKTYPLPQVGDIVRMVDPLSDSVTVGEVEAVYKDGEEFAIKDIRKVSGPGQFFDSGVVQRDRIVWVFPERLINAAPELLEACRAALLDAEYRSDSVVSDAIVITALRRAVALAEGGQR